MKFHLPSFLLGVGITAAAMSARERIRPVLVEVSALGLHLYRVGRGLFERQRENVEDLWAEIDLEARMRGGAKRSHEPSFVNGSGAAR